MPSIYPELVRKASFFATPCSLLHMAHSFCFRTQRCVSFVEGDTVFSEQTGLESPRSCVSYEMERSRTFRLRVNFVVSWSSMRCREKTRRCLSLISLHLVSLVLHGQRTCSNTCLPDKQLEGVPREKIRNQLIEVGFDDTRQSELVGGLSGGWKMKLELARAMLYNADLLLLDEVRASLSMCLLRSRLITSFILAYESC